MDNYTILASFKCPDCTEKWESEELDGEESDLHCNYTRDHCPNCGKEEIKSISYKVEVNKY